jgi:transcriptional regulator with GAF, ATPase, and Fis domain
MGESVSQIYFANGDASQVEAEVVTSLRFNGNGKAMGSFGGIIGRSQAWTKIIEQIEIVAPTDATVLILGETGTGKELVARELHRRSRRKDKPLVRVNCACIPKELYESEFFGHAKGAFTSTIRDRVGRFGAADAGTLFLDEIGEIPLQLQSKLLHALQDRCYERVGEEKTRRADVRVIAATNRDLKKEVSAGRFREDLYYRLNVVPLKVVPLRDRKDDIPLLAKHFVEVSVRELGCPRPRLTPAGIETLQTYDWPGNIRELRNVIERASIVAQGGALDFDLPFSASSLSLTSFELEPIEKVESEFLTDAEIRRRERENVFAVLRKTNWKIKGVDGAADLLGLNPSTLISRMAKMGLKRPY